MSKQMRAVIGVLAAILVLGIGFTWWFLRDDAPDEVSLDAAAKGVKESGASTSVGSGSGSGGTGSKAVTTVDGKWVVDTETGDFDWDTATGTFAGFRIKEKLANIGETTAVGRTGEVSGGLEIKGSQVVKAEFTVDLGSLKTNNNMRDSRVRQALDVSKYPEAKLTVTEPIDLPDDAASGGKVTVEAKGELTLHGVTNDVTVAIEAKYLEGQIVIVGSTPIVFSDFDLEVPGSPVVLSVDDHGEIEFQALMKRP